MQLLAPLFDQCGLTSLLLFYHRFTRLVLCGLIFWNVYQKVQLSDHPRQLALLPMLAIQVPVV